MRWSHGGAAHRVKGVILMDSLYGDEEKFAAWAAARRRLAFLLSAYTELDQGRERHLARPARQAAIPHADALPKALTPGTIAFVAVRSWEMHGDFMTRAWAPDPLKQALPMIPGYPMPVRAKKSA